MSKEIDFSKAPEGATHYVDIDFFGAKIMQWMKDIDGSDYLYVIGPPGAAWSKGRDKEIARSAKEIPSQWSIYNNKKPLKDLTDEQAAKLFNHWRNGGDVELFHGRWAKHDYGYLCTDDKYRAKQKSEREIGIAVAEGIIDKSNCFKDDRATAIAAACCLVDSGRFKLVEQ